MATLWEVAVEVEVEVEVEATSFEVEAVAHRRRCDSGTSLPANTCQKLHRPPCNSDHRCCLCRHRAHLRQARQQESPLVVQLPRPKTVASLSPLEIKPDLSVGATCRLWAVWSVDSSVSGRSGAQPSPQVPVGGATVPVASAVCPPGTGAGEPFYASGVRAIRTSARLPDIRCGFPNSGG